MPHHDERPSSLQIQISQAVLSNCRVGAKCSQTDILNDLQDFIGSRLYADMSVFPNGSNDLAPYPNAAWLNDYSINHHQLQNLTKRDKGLYSRLRRDNNLPHQIWCFWCDQIWVEFAGVEKACDRPISFIDAFPLRIWACTGVPYFEGLTPRPSVSTLSSDSVEVAEVATEFDEPADIKFNKMNVVYDVNLGRVVQQADRRASLSTQQRLIPVDSSSASASSSPGPIRSCSSTVLPHKPLHRSSQGLSNNKTESKCNGNWVMYTKEDIDAMNSLRTTRSENDLNLAPPPNHLSKPPGSNSAQNFVNGRRVSDYARGGPPPPYNDDVCDEKSRDNLNASYSSLPPAYEALPDDPGPIEKPVINDFIQYDVENLDLRVASLALLMHTSKNVQVQLDHFQLLFLIRLGEDFAAMMEKVEADNEKCDQERRISLNQLNPSPMGEINEDDGLILSMMIPNVIVDLVLSPCIGIDPVQTYSLTDRVQYEKEKSENHNDQFLPAVDAMDCLPIISSYEAINSIKPSVLTERIGHQSASDVGSLILGHPSPTQLPRKIGEEKPTGMVNAVIDHMSSDVQCIYQSDVQNITEQLITSDESLDMTEHQTVADPLILTENQSTSEMEFSVPDVYGSSAYDQTANTNSPGAECNDVFHQSPQGGLYCEVNENVILDCGAGHDNPLHDPHAFDQTLKEVADIGIQVGNSMMNVNLKPRPEDQLISVLRIRIGCLFIGVEAEGKDSLVKVSAETLRLNELGNMKYGKLLDPRGIIGTERQQEKRQINMDSLIGNGVLKLRLGAGSYAEQLAVGTSETGFADIRVNSLAAALLMSTIDNLLEFGEDEIINLPLPFAVDVTLSDISIYDDKPRRYKSAVKLPPSQIVIDEIYLMRDKGGVTTIKEKQGRKTNSTEVDQTDGELISIGSYAPINSNLIAESVNQQVDALIGENSRLLEDLKIVNAKMNGLHSERDSLLKVIGKLQHELIFSNRENDELQNRVRSLSLSRHQGHYV